MYKLLAFIVVTAVMFVGLETRAADNPSHMQNTSLPGDTYKSLTLFLPKPGNCQKACNADENCKAWTFQAKVRPSLKNPTAQAQCYLKNKVPKAVTNSCCVSGITNFVRSPNVVGTIEQVKPKPILVVPPRKLTKPQKPNITRKKAPLVIVKPVGVKPPMVKVKPVNPNPPTTKVPTNLPPTRRALIVPAIQPPNKLANPAVVSMFDNITAKRGKAVRDALENQKRIAVANAELRRRRSANRPTGRFVALLDCDDNDPGIHPNQNEVCNFKDDNCNGIVDEGVTITVYRDADGDGFGDPDQRVEACAAGGGLAGMSLNANDCDDSSARLNPAAGTCE